MSIEATHSQDRDQDQVQDRDQSVIDRFDELVDRLFEPLRRSRPLNHIFYSASALADHSTVWLILACGQAITHKRSQRGQRALIALLVESGLVNIVVKTLFQRERPVQVVERPLPLRQPLTSSFPSGHATAATCAAVLLSTGNKTDRIVIALAALVALSRIHVRIHHASDVAGGIVIGFLYAQIVKRLFPL